MVVAALPLAPPPPSTAMALLNVCVMGMGFPANPPLRRRRHFGIRVELVGIGAMEDVRSELVVLTTFWRTTQSQMAKASQRPKCLPVLASVQSAKWITLMAKSGYCTFVILPINYLVEMPLANERSKSERGVIMEIATKCCPRETSNSALSLKGKTLQWMAPNANSHACCGHPC